MFTADLADTPLASYEPDVTANDSPGDLLRDALSQFIPESWRRQAFAAIDQVLEAVEVSRPERDDEQIAHGILQAVYGDTSHEPEIRVIAAAALKRFGKDGRSYQQIGDEFAVTRACVQAHSRRIEKRTGIKCRSDKSDTARQISTDNATGRQRSGVRAGGVIRERGGLRRLLGAFRIRGL